MRIARALVPQQAERRRRRTIAIVGTRMPSGHVCTPCTDAPWPHADRPTPYVRPARSARRAMAALWPHARACCPPVVKVAALTRRAHPLKTTGAMPGKSLEAHCCDITRPLPLRTIVSCLSCPQCLRRMLPRNRNLRYHVERTRGGSVARHGGGGSETRHFIEKRTYTTVLLVHPPALVHGQRRA